MSKQTKSVKQSKWSLSAKYNEVDFVRIFSDVPSDVNVLRIQVGELRVLAIRTDAWYRAQRIDSISIEWGPRENYIHLGITPTGKLSLEIDGAPSIKGWMMTLCTVEDELSKKARTAQEVKKYLELTELEYNRKHTITVEVF